jgi:PIN domain nuclease of toxin-antitoxin system
VIVFDTHSALWFVTDNGLLGKRSQLIADQALEANELAVSAISFWEIALLIAKRRIRSLDSASETRALILRAGINELAVTGEIGILAAEIENLHGDPADRLIAATAISHDATLITSDEKLLSWRHPLRRQNADL